MTVKQSNGEGSRQSERKRLSCDEAVPFVFTFALSHAHVGSALAALLGAEAALLGAEAALLGAEAALVFIIQCARALV